MLDVVRFENVPQSHVLAQKGAGLRPSDGDGVAVYISQPVNTVKRVRVVSISTVKDVNIQQTPTGDPQCVMMASDAFLPKINQNREYLAEYCQI